MSQSTLLATSAGQGRRQRLNDLETIWCLVAGDGTVADPSSAFATYQPGGELAIGLEADLVFAVRPGDARIRAWLGGNEILRDTANGGSFPSDLWSDSNDGSFASAESGDTSGNVPATSNQAPDGFEVIEPLSVFVNQRPRHFF